MMGPCCGKLWGFFIIIALSGAGYLLLTSDGRQLLDRRPSTTPLAEQLVLPRRAPAPWYARPRKLDERLKAQGVTLGAPVFLRIFKLESELEIWMEKDGRYRKFPLSDLPVVGTARPEA